MVGRIVMREFGEVAALFGLGELFEPRPESISQYARQTR